MFSILSGRGKGKPPFSLFFFLNFIWIDICAAELQGGRGDGHAPEPAPQAHSGRQFYFIRQSCCKNWFICTLDVLQTNLLVTNNQQRLLPVFKTLPLL